MACCTQAYGSSGEEWQQQRQARQTVNRRGSGAGQHSRAAALQRGRREQAGRRGMQVIVRVLCAAGTEVMPEI